MILSLCPALGYSLKRGSRPEHRLSSRGASGITMPSAAAQSMQYAADRQQVTHSDIYSSTPGSQQVEQGSQQGFQRGYQQGYREGVQRGVQMAVERSLRGLQTYAAGSSSVKPTTTAQLHQPDPNASLGPARQTEAVTPYEHAQIQQPIDGPAPSSANQPEPPKSAKGGKPVRRGERSPFCLRCMKHRTVLHLNPKCVAPCDGALPCN